MTRKRTRKRTRQSGPVPAHVTSIPTQWNPDRPRQAYELALMGATDDDLARVMGVDINTISLWKRTHPEFLQKLLEGKDIADAAVAHSLYKRATGFTVIETHVAMYRGEIIQTPIPKYYPPDSWAANKWLSLRQRTKWGDVTRIETLNTNVNIHKIDISDIPMEQLLMLKQIAQQKCISAHDNDQN